jgi:hypothetical protein
MCWITEIVLYIQKSESHAQMTNQCAPWKIANVMEYLVLQALQFYYGYLL